MWWCNVYFFILYLPLFFNFVTVSQFDTLEDDECTLKDSGQRGVCLSIDKCDYAKELLKKKQTPQNCSGFDNIFPIVCCPKHKSELKCFDYFGVIDIVPFGVIDVVPFVSSEKISLEKENVSHNGVLSTNRVPKGIILPPKGFRVPSITTTIYKGLVTPAKGFPHMAVLGYGDKENIDWSCGGSLISQEFVLTAAHCINSRDLGSVKWIRLGDLDLKNTTDDAKPQDFTISKIHIHPQYKAPSHYHDIALIQLDRKAVFDDYVKPACLHTEMSAPSKLIITGWGTVDFLGEKSSRLLEAKLNQVDPKICNKTYETISKRKLSSGILDDLQICAGRPEGQDTCPGDSGGPLQYKVPNGASPYFKIVGITSFGKGCGLENSVGVYTRVSNYLQWIEDIVWIE